MSYDEGTLIRQDQISGASGQCKTFSPKEYYKFDLKQLGVGVMVFEGPHCSGDKVDLPESGKIRRFPLMPRKIQSVQFWYRARNAPYPVNCQYAS